MNQQEALKWIAEVFQQPPDSIQPETLRRDIVTWDSLGVLMLMAELDEKHGIMLSDVELNAMTKAGDILEVLRREGKLQ
jgi:acyl carrier protein